MEVLFLCFVRYFENNRCELLSYHCYLKLRNSYFDIIPKIDVKLFWALYTYLLPQWYFQQFLILWKIRWYVKGNMLNKIKYIPFSKRISLEWDIFMQESGSDLIVIGSEVTFKLWLFIIPSQCGLYGKNSNLNL